MTRYANMDALRHSISPDVVVILLIVLIVAFAVAMIALGTGVKRGKK